MKMTLFGLLTLLLVSLMEVQAQNTPASAKAEMVIQNFAFQPKELKVKVGTTVKFTNKDALAHSAADDKSFDTRLLEQNQSKIRFAKAGTFKLHCGFHPSMTGPSSSASKPNLPTNQGLLVTGELLTF